MKLSKDTQSYLKNLSTINTNLLIKPGSSLMTISADKAVYAKINVAETFTTEFGIYDLSEFLGALSLFEDPDLEFSKTHVTIKQGRNSIKYFSANADVLTVPAKELVLKGGDYKFKLSASDLSLIQRTASVLRANDIIIEGNGEKIVVTVCDKANSAANSFTQEVGTTTETFKATMKASNLKLMPFDYDAEICMKKAIKFTSGDIEYVCVLEADSVF